MNKEKAKLCECGCGNYAKPGNRFISGHNRRGVKLDNDLKKRISESESRFYEENSVSNETREKLRIAGLGRKHTDEAREKMRIAVLGRKHTDEARENMRIAQLRHEVSNEARENMGIAQLGNTNGLGYKHTDETRILMSCIKLGITRDEWDGFGSVYCDLWCEELREYIRNKYNRQCFICNKTEEENGRKHDVHHIDYNKDCGCDGTECRLVPLCKSCHSKTTSGDREMWEELIMDMLEKCE